MTSSHPFSDEYFSFLDFEKNVTIDSRSLTIDTLSSSSLPSLSVTNKAKNTVTISFYQFSLIWKVLSLLAKGFQSMFMGSGVDWKKLASKDGKVLIILYKFSKIWHVPQYNYYAGLKFLVSLVFLFDNKVTKVTVTLWPYQLELCNLLW